MIFHRLQKIKQQKDLLTDVLFVVNPLLALRSKIMRLYQIQVWQLIFVQQLPDDLLDLSAGKRVHADTSNRKFSINIVP